MKGESGSRAGWLQLIQKQLGTLGEISQEPLAVIGMVKSILGDGWFKAVYTNPLDPERLKAMAEAGELLRDVREVAGLNLHQLSERVGMKDDELRAVEKGEKALSLEMIFRIASLIARHDPLPFIFKFLRTYTPAVDSALEKLGIDALPRYIVRERRFANVYRKHDMLRDLSDEEFERFITYTESSMRFILDVMITERSLRNPAAAPEVKEEAQAAKPATIVEDDYQP